MIVPDEQQATLNLIDQRQDLLLEDLDRLNQQILDIIDVYTHNRGLQDPAKQDAAA